QCVSYQQSVISSQSGKRITEEADILFRRIPGASQPRLIAALFSVAKGTALPSGVDAELMAASETSHKHV
ncbi:MAG: hypothetical protein PHD28_07360, partial [Proteiniphilum sp.]|nr:hypothetical protein [Proteiniphilum sp.]